MKPLNRPMFRYGGPIKEGVMSGIREPKKNGGLSKQFNTGLVGDERYPKTNGREHHLAFIPAMGMAALRFLPAAYRGFKAARAYTPMSKQLGTFGRIKDIFTPKCGLAGKGAAVGKMGPEKLLKGQGAGFRTGSFFRQNPITSLSLLPQASVGAYKVGKAGVEAVPGIAKAYIDALVPGESIFRKKPSSEIEMEGGPPGGGNPDMFLAPKGDKPPPGLKLSAEQLRKNQIEKYRDIMDIKGMNKDAAYNSLIAASQAINESGDFKGDIKSGKLINQIIQATSKQFDKPKATKDAIDTLILKSEIEKDLKASDPAAKLAAELTGKKIKLADKQLKGETLEDTVNNIYARTGAFPSGSGLAGVARTKGIDIKDVAKSEDINNFLKANPGKNEVDFMESQVQITIEKGKPIVPGAYVVKDRIIVIDSEGNVSPYL